MSYISKHFGKYLQNWVPSSWQYCPLLIVSNYIIFILTILLVNCLIFCLQQKWPQFLLSLKKTHFLLLLTFQLYIIISQSLQQIVSTLIILQGYYNLDLACHVSNTGVNQAVLFGPLSNLRFTPQTGQTIGDNDPANVVFSKSQMRCECSLIALTNSAQRNEVITCNLFRLRCPIVSTLNVSIVTP